MLILGLHFTFAEAGASVDIREWNMSSTCAGPSGDIPLPGLQAAQKDFPLQTAALFTSLGSLRTLLTTFP